MNIRLFFAAAAAVLLGAAGPARAGETNEKCPLMTEDDVDTEQLVEYEGMKVYFCCQTCRKLFNENPKYVIKASLELLPQFAEMKEKLELDKVTLLPQHYCPVTRTNLVTPESPALEYKGEKVYLWNDKAVAEWKKDPDGCAKRGKEAGLLPQLDKKKEGEPPANNQAGK